MTEKNNTNKSNWVAALLGLTLGPAGLWYKRRWTEGGVWLTFTLLFGIGPGGMGLPLLPFLLIAMSLAAAWADVGPE